jgi:hypothetical protein
MADHGSSAAGDTAVDPAFLKDRQAMLGGFVNFTTYGIAGVVTILVLMAIFLI